MLAAHIWLHLANKWLKLAKRWRALAKSWPHIGHKLRNGRAFVWELTPRRLIVLTLMPTDVSYVDMFSAAGKSTLELPIPLEPLRTGNTPKHARRGTEACQRWGAERKGLWKHTHIHEEEGHLAWCGGRTRSLCSSVLHYCSNLGKKNKASEAWDLKDHLVCL